MKSFFERIGAIKKKYRVEFVLEKLTTNMTNLKDSIVIQIKRGSHKQQTEPTTFLDEDIEFGKQTLIFDPVTMYYDDGNKKYTSKEGEIRILIVKGDEKKVGGTISFDLSEYLNDSSNPEGKRVHIYKKGELFTGKSSKAKFKLTYQIYLKFLRDTNSDADSDLEVMISNKLGKKNDKREKQFEMIDKLKEKEKKEKKKKQGRNKDNTNQNDEQDNKVETRQKQKQKQKDEKKKEPKTLKQQNLQQLQIKKDVKVKQKKQQHNEVLQQGFNDSKINKQKKDKKNKKKYESMSEQEEQNGNQQIVKKSSKQQKLKKENKPKQIKKQKSTEQQKVPKFEEPIQTVSLDDIFKNMTEQTPSKTKSNLKKTTKVQKTNQSINLPSTSILQSARHETPQIQKSIVQSYHKPKQPIKPKTPKIIQNKSLSYKQSYYQQQIQNLQKLKRQLLSKNTDLKQKEKQLIQDIKETQESKQLNSKNIRATTFNTVEQYSKTIRQLQSKINEVDKQNSIEIIKYQQLKTKYEQAASNIQLDKIESQNQIKEKQYQYKKELSQLENNLKQFKDKQAKMNRQLDSLKNQKVKLTQSIEKINSSPDSMRERHAEEQLNEEKKKIINALNAANQEGNSNFVDFIEKYLPTQ